MSNTLVTGQFINSRIYFDPFDDKNENLYIAEGAKKDINETGMTTHWMLTGVFYWALGFASLIHYNQKKNGKDVANFVFVNKASCESWIKKFSTASWNEGFADKKFANHEATIKYICDKAISKISQDNADKKSKISQDNADKKAMDDIYNAAIKQAKDHFKGNKDEVEIIQFIENCLNLYNYKENKFRQKVTFGGDEQWNQGIRDGGPEDQAYQFMEKHLRIAMTCLL